jgi:hypothetical protein
MRLRRGSRARLHELDESIEQTGHVMRSGTRFGMALETERWCIEYANALIGAV